VRYQLVDRILELEKGERIVGTKTFSKDAEFLANHFPRRGLIPITLLVEAGGQLASRLIKDSLDQKVEPFLVLVEGAMVLGEPTVGVPLRFEVEVLSLDARASRVTFSIWENSDRILAVESISFAHAPIKADGTSRSGDGPVREASPSN
jgi:3-hydroxyacyl-[acyl-carrier-protein] dehydratase